MARLSQTDKKTLQESHANQCIKNDKMILKPCATFIPAFFLYELMA